MNQLLELGTVDREIAALNAGIHGDESHALILSITPAFGTVASLGTSQPSGFTIPGLNKA
ncbi:hypothetical protein N9Z27_00265 [Alphaproteobacteria bacterium]|nr:hypothetical protein [Alphaproteobacteria bacterium]